MEGLYKIAEHTVRVISLYKKVHIMCRDYRAAEEAPEIVISTSQADIDAERRKSEQEDRLEGIPVRRFADDYLETLAVYRKLADALLTDFSRTADEAPELPALAPLFFRWRLAAILGLAPDMEHCGICGGPVGEEALLVVDEGRLRCRACRAERTAAGVVPERYGVELTGAALDVLRRVQQEFPSEWRRSPLLPADRRACGRAVDGFVQYHLGLAWENGYFRRV